jgi:tetratricopeptide (TPR) repeat protein
MPRRVAIVFSFLLVASGVSYSQFQAASPSPFEGPPFSLSATAIRTASAAIRPEKLSDATVLYAETDYRFAQNGALTYTSRMVYRIETPKGVEDWGEISLEWDPWYENPSQLHARVLQTDGNFAELDQKTITDAPVNSNDQDTYGSARERKAPLPGLAVGAIVEQVISDEDTTPYFSAGLTYRYFFTSSAPAERQKVVVDIPSALPFQDRLMNTSSLPSSYTETNGIRHMEYVLDHIPARIYGDIDLPSATAPIPLLEFATGSSWGAVAQRYAELSDPKIIPDQVRSILPLPAAGTRLQRIQQLVQLLHKNVRYTGIEFGEAQLVPQAPSEVLKRHYGDCKDKAAFLVSMLRAEGIPANLALLSSGTGRDVDPDMPGMNFFNHAIVYVSASDSDPALWIDATAEFNEVGTLPYEDADRFALIIAPDTAKLVKTPAPKPEDSVLTETRTFHLADFGPSQATEDSETHGYVDADYRSFYGSTTTQKMHDDLEHYAESDYLAKQLTKIDHGEGTDLSRPFHLTLAMESARRGYTSLVDSEVAIFPTSVLNNLPEWIRTAPTPLPESATPEQKQQRELAEQHRSETYHIEPFIYEQHYNITAPVGFALRGLPQDQTTHLGPATLTEHYSQQSPGAVQAVIRFTSGKSVLTAQEALDMRDAVAAVSKRPFIEIAFLEQGQQLFQAGKVKEAFASEEAATSASSRLALPHARFARLLIDAGVGNMARTEAARAVQIDPSSGPALMTRGWVLEHDEMGRLFGVGFDRAGALAALKSAMEHRSDDLDPRFDLAVLNEYSPDAVRYGPGSDLPAAIELYRSLIESAKKEGSSNLQLYRVNLGFALLYAHQFSQLDELLPDIAPGLVHSSLAVASAVAQKDAAAGIAVVDQLNLTAENRSNALVSAGRTLAEMGLYPQAAEILSKGIDGQKDAPALASRIEIYRNLKHASAEAPPVTSPESLAYKMMVITGKGGSDRKTVEAMLSPRSFADDAAFQRDVDSVLQDSDGDQRTDPSLNSDPSPTIWQDMVLGTVTFNVKGNDSTGYNLLAEFLGRREHFFVVKENGAFRIVSNPGHGGNAAVGRYALYALDHGQYALAKSLLDYERDLMHRDSADDPLSGYLLPRFWAIDSARPGADSPESMRIAAISLLEGSMDIKPLLDNVVVQLRDKASGTRQENFDLLLARGYTGAEQPAAALPYINNLLQEEPDSAEALQLASSTYQLNGDVKSWKQLLDSRLKIRPDDADLLRQQFRLLAYEHDYAGARASLKRIFDSGHATGSDYNSYAWLGLFDNSLGPDVTEAAQKANALSNNSEFNDLHTTACVYAAQGRFTEARQVLEQALEAGGFVKPTAPVWYALGLLYEKYGLPDAALAAYRKVPPHDEDDGHTFIDPGSTYLLAQQGIHRLGK